MVWLSSQLGCVSPVPCVRPSRVALITKHALDDLTRFCGVNSFLFHLLVACWERGFHYFSGDRSGESSKEEVSAFIVSCGVFGKAEQFFERRDVSVDVGPLHVVGVKGSPCPLLF